MQTREMGTLGPLLMEYVRARRARGEIGTKTAGDIRYTLQGVAKTFGNRPLGRFGPSDIDRWLETTARLSPASRRRQLSQVRVFCRWLVAQGHTKKNPTDHVPSVKQPRTVPVTVPDDDVALLLDVCPDARARCIVNLMVICGLRCVEVSRLTLADYDPRARNLTVNGKGGHQRTIPVPDAAARSIDAYLDEAGRVHGPLIRACWQGGGHGHTALSPKTVSEYVGRWIKLAGIKSRPQDGRSAHGLRRTAASDVMDKVGDVRIVQAMLGHARIETTALYLRPTGLDKMREAMEGRDYSRPDPAA